MKKIAIFLALGLFLISPAYAQNSVSPEEKALIKELLDVTGSKNLARSMGEQMGLIMMNAFKEQDPNISSTILDAIHEETNAAFNDEIESGSFYEMYYPIYAKQLTPEDIKELLAFYKTPIGQKTIKVMPIIAQESMAAGEIMGKNLVPKINERIKRRLEQLKKQ